MNPTATEAQGPEPDKSVDGSFENDDPNDDLLPSTGLLSFYDHLRRQVVRTVERRGGKLGSGTAEALLLVPDVFMLVARLTLDPDVPKSERALFASTLVYFIMPFDLLPEGIIGPTGYLDDLVLALSAVSKALGRDLEPYAEKYWSGPQPLRTVLRDVLETGKSLTGTSLYERLKGMLAGRGIEVPPSGQSSPAAQ